MRLGDFALGNSLTAAIRTWAAAVQIDTDGGTKTKPSGTCAVSIIVQPLARPFQFFGSKQAVPLRIFDHDCFDG